MVRLPAVAISGLTIFAQLTTALPAAKPKNVPILPFDDSFDVETEVFTQTLTNLKTIYRSTPSTDIPTATNMLTSTATVAGKTMTVVHAEVSAAPSQPPLPNAELVKTVTVTSSLTAFIVHPTSTDNGKAPPLTSASGHPIIEIGTATIFNDPANTNNVVIGKETLFPGAQAKHVAGALISVLGGNSLVIGHATVPFPAIPNILPVPSVSFGFQFSLPHITTINIPTGSPTSVLSFASVPTAAVPAPTATTIAPSTSQSQPSTAMSASASSSSTSIAPSTSQSQPSIAASTGTASSSAQAASESDIPHPTISNVATSNPTTLTYTQWISAGSSIPIVSGLESSGTGTHILTVTRSIFGSDGAPSSSSSAQSASDASPSSVASSSSTPSSTEVQSHSFPGTSLPGPPSPATSAISFSSSSFSSSSHSTSQISSSSSTSMMSSSSSTSLTSSTRPAISSSAPDSTRSSSALNPSGTPSPSSPSSAHSSSSTHISSSTPSSSSSSESSIFSTSSISSSSSLPSTAQSSKSSAAAASATPSDGGSTNICKAGGKSFTDGQQYTDSDQQTYTIHCSQDNSQPAYSIFGVSSGGFQRCFAACDATPQCQGWTFSGSESGNCYLKSKEGSYSSAPSTVVSGFKMSSDDGSVSGGSGAASSQTTPSSQVTSSSKATPSSQATSSSQSTSSATSSSATGSASGNDCSALASSGAAYTDRKGVQYTLSCKHDIAGNDLSAYSAPTFKDCFIACDTNSKCAGFSWLVDDGPGTCYLKTSLRGQPSPSNADLAMKVNFQSDEESSSVRPPASSTSASKPASTSQGKSCQNIGTSNTFATSTHSYTVSCGIDHGGADLSNAPSASFGDCFSKCDAISGCIGFAYLGGSGPGTCYFKSALSPASANPNVDSAFRAGPDDSASSSGALSKPTTVSSSESSRSTSSQPTTTSSTATSSSSRSSSSTHSTTSSLSSLSSSTQSKTSSSSSLSHATSSSVASTSKSSNTLSTSGRQTATRIVTVTVSQSGSSLLTSHSISASSSVPTTTGMQSKSVVVVTVFTTVKSTSTTSVAAAPSLPASEPKSTLTASAATSSSTSPSGPKSTLVAATTVTASGKTGTASMKSVTPSVTTGPTHGQVTGLAYDGSGNHFLATKQQPSGATLMDGALVTSLRPGSPISFDGHHVAIAPQDNGLVVDGIAYMYSTYTDGVGPVLPTPEIVASSGVFRSPIWTTVYQTLTDNDNHVWATGSASRVGYSTTTRVVTPTPSTGIDASSTSQYVGPSALPEKGIKNPTPLTTGKNKTECDWLAGRPSFALKTEYIKGSEGTDGLFLAAPPHDQVNLPFLTPRGANAARLLFSPPRGAIAHHTGDTGGCDFLGLALSDPAPRGDGPEFGGRALWVPGLATGGFVLSKHDLQRGEYEPFEHWLACRAPGHMAGAGGAVLRYQPHASWFMPSTWAASRVDYSLCAKVRLVPAYD